MLVSPDELDAIRAGEGPVVVAAPTASLADAVSLMTRWDQVSGVVLARDVMPVSAGIGMLVAPDAVRFSVLTYADKTRCIARIRGLVAAAGAPETTCTAIEQCLDELTTNALYDAPVDASGHRVFAGVPVRSRIGMRTHARVELSYAHEDGRFVIAIRDGFGSLDRASVLRFLDKALHSDAPVDAKAGGAGLGLYLVATVATAVVFNVAPGVATEVVCIFDPERPRLEQLGFYQQRDVQGLTGAGAARRITVTPPRVLAMRAAYGVVAVSAIIVAVLAYQRIAARGATAQLVFATTRGATVELEGHPVAPAADGSLSVAGLALDRAYRVVARLDGYQTRRTLVTPHAGINDIAIQLVQQATIDVESRPSGALVTIDGKPYGSTPRAVSTLAPGSTVSIELALPGYRASVVRVQVPASGTHHKIVRDLERAADAASVRFVSVPPGAAVVHAGQGAGPDRSYTPVEIIVQAGQEQRFALVMPHHSLLVIPAFTLPPGATLERGGTLSDK